MARLGTRCRGRGPARDAAGAADARQVGEGDPRPGQARRPAAFEPKWDGFRCLVFKDGDEVELTCRNTKPLTRYFPEVVAAMREQLPERCVLDGELFVAPSASADAGVRGAPGAHPPGRRPGSTCSRRRPRPASSPSTCSRSATSPTSTARSPSAGRRWRRRWPGSTGPCYLTRTTTDPAVAEELVRPSSRAPGSTAWSPSRWGRRTSRTPAPCSRSSTSAPPTSWSPATASTRPPRRSEPLLGSLLLGLYADGQLQHIGVSASFTGRARAELIERAAAAGLRDRGAPVGRWMGPGLGDRQPRPGARHPEPLERRQGPLLHPAAPRPGAGGRLRPHGGPAVPAHRPLPALAHRPRPGVVRLRPARGAGQLRPR